MIGEGICVFQIIRVRDGVDVSKSIRSFHEYVPGQTKRWKVQEIGLNFKMKRARVSDFGLDEK